MRSLKSIYIQHYQIECMRYWAKLFFDFVPSFVVFYHCWKYLNIISFDGLVYFTLLLLRRKLVYLDFHFKKISIIFWTITLLLSGLSFSFFKQANYLYMTKAYCKSVMFWKQKSIRSFVEIRDMQLLWWKVMKASKMILQ